MAQKPRESGFIRKITREAERAAGSAAARRPGNRNRFTVGRVVNPDRFDSRFIRGVKKSISYDTTPMPYAGASADAREPLVALTAFRSEVLAKLRDAEAANADRHAAPDSKIAANISAAKACTQGLQALCEHHFSKGGQPSDLVGGDVHLYESCIRGFHRCHTAARGLLGSYGRIGGSPAMQRQHEIALSAVKKNHAEAIMRLKKYVPEERIPKAT
ncbi:MAG: hypothetical protein WCX64_06230 [Candidatus Micrarchaeia archaeon]